MKTESKLTYDDVVKNIFTNRITGKKYAAEVIGNILNMNPKEIYDNLEYIHPEVKYHKDIVGSITDIPFTTDKILIDIEVNRSNGKKRKIQNESYLFQLYLGELKSYKDYVKLKPVVQINLDNYDYLNKKEFLYCSMLMDTKYHEITSENIKIFHVNLKLLREIEDYKDISEDRLKTILYLLASSNSKIISRLYEGDELMKEVKKQAEKFAYTVNWADSYFDSDEFFKMDVRDEMEEEIKRELFEEIKKDVTEKVTNEVTKKVTNEVTEKNKIEFVQNLLNEKIPDDLICKYVNINSKDLNIIKEKLSNK